jgi:hypothetical protein
VKKNKKEKRRDPFALPAKSRKAGPFKNKKKKIKHKKKISENDE